MKHKWLIGCLGILMMLLYSCKEDENPSARELILAHSWRVDHYDVTATTGTVGLSQSLLEPFKDAIVEQIPLNGIITFMSDDSFIIDNQGTELNGTWSLENNEADIIMNFPILQQTYTLSIDKISSGNFDATYVTEEMLTISGFPTVITAEFKIKSFMIPV